jgi:hypothetical protein
MAETGVRIPLAVLTAPRSRGAFVVNDGMTDAAMGKGRTGRSTGAASEWAGRGLVGEYANEHRAACGRAVDAAGARDRMLDPVGAYALDPMTARDDGFA